MSFIQYALYACNNVDDVIQLSRQCFAVYFQVFCSCLWFPFFAILQASYRPSCLHGLCISNLADAADRCESSAKCCRSIDARQGP
jgi:hypothetical protein